MRWARSPVIEWFVDMGGVACYLFPVELGVQFKAFITTIRSVSPWSVGVVSGDDGTI